MNTKTRCRIAAVVFQIGLAAGLAVRLSSVAYGAEEPPSEATRPEPDRPREWKVVEPPDLLDVSSMLASQMRSNFEKIRTWSGKYEYQDSSLMKRELVEKLVEDSPEDSPWKRLKLGRENVPALMRIEVGRIVFAIDVESDSFSTAFEVHERRLRDLETLESVESPETGFFQRSVVTPEHYLSFEPRISHGRFQDIPPVGPPRGAAAFRDPVSKAANQTWAIVVDPRDFFGTAEDQKFWDVLEILADAISPGGTSEENQEAVAAAITLRTGETDNAVHYHLEFAGKWEGQDQGKIEWFLNDQAGFNVTEVYNRDPSGQIVSHMALDYQLKDGIFVPAFVSYAITTEDRKRYRFQRILQLKECVLNEPIDPSQFTYTGLGLKDGDRILDRIEGASFVMEDGVPVKLAEFGQKLEEPAEMGGIGPLTRLIYVALSVVVLVAVILILRVRRARTGTERSTG